MSLPGAGGDFQGNSAFQGPHRNRCPQDRLPWSQLQMANQIGPARAPIRVLGIPDAQIDVSGTASTQTPRRLCLALE